MGCRYWSMIVSLCAFSSGVLAADPISFRMEIAPILETHCVGCHSGKLPKGDLDLTNSKRLYEGGANGPALEPGSAAKSRMIRLLHEKKMPPKTPLAATDIARLSRWIDEGAKWEGGSLQLPAKIEPAKRAGLDWWSLQPIRRPAVPIPTVQGWTENPIDAFVKSGLEKKGLKPNAEADRRTLIRRVTMDLTGLRPRHEEVDAFIHDTSPLAYERLVDRLLGSPAFGERWARHWLDVVRFAESNGYEVNTLRTNAWPYRDWVIRAFNRDLPFDQFVREQLAGDTVSGADELSQAATGFIVGGAHDLVGNSTEEGKRQQRSDDLFDMVSTTSTAFLGLTTGCARCHDHKFDPIAQRDFYRMEGIFAGVDHAERPIRLASVLPQPAELNQIRERLLVLNRQIDAAEPIAVPTNKGTPRLHRDPLNSRRNVERLQPIEARFIRFTVNTTNDNAQPCIDELEIFTEKASDGNIALATAGAKATASSEFPNSSLHKILHLNDGIYGNSKSWISDQLGEGWAQIELPRPATIARIVWGRDREQKYRDRTAMSYKIEISLDGKIWSPVAGSWDRGKASTVNPDLTRLVSERDSLQVRLALLDKPITVYAGNFRTPEPTHFLKRGDVMDRAEVMVPGTINGIGPAMTLPANATDAERRNALASWLVSPENHLPTRVMVNRIWQNHFGQGLVRTPSDYGFNGDRPSHPELLEWLASEYRANGGHMKPLHRIILLSKTYRQSSLIDPAQVSIDAEHRMLWRFESRRIQAEAIRDSTLQVSGSLNRVAGGPGYNLWTYSNYVTVYAPKPILGPDEFRRMIYQFKPRAQQDGAFGAFDCPDATATVPRRTTSVTALQALNLLNDKFMFDQAEKFAKQIESLTKDEEMQVKTGFRLAFQRDPSPRESQAAVKLVQSAGLANFCRMLLNTNEFVTLE